MTDVCLYVYMCIINTVTDHSLCAALHYNHLGTCLHILFKLSMHHAEHLTTSVAAGIVAERMPPPTTSALNTHNPCIPRSPNYLAYPCLQ